MRIFFCVLLVLLLLADTIRSQRKGGALTIGLRQIDALLRQLEESEEKGDRRLEKKMDQALKNLTTSVRQIHEKLKAFIASDNETSSDMKSQLESMSEQVSKMETSVKMKMAKPFAVEEAAADEGKTNDKQYDCQEDDVVYMYRKFPDAPAGFKERKTDTWQESQKECAEMEPCKGFTWHQENNHYKKVCSLFSTFTGKVRNRAVSGPKECPNK